MSCNRFIGLLLALILGVAAIEGGVVKKRSTGLFENELTPEKVSFSLSFFSVIGCFVPAHYILFFKQRHDVPYLSGIFEYSLGTDRR